MQILQITDPALVAEALRNKDLDKRLLKSELRSHSYMAGPHSLPTLLTSVSNERWKRVRWVLLPQEDCFQDEGSRHLLYAARHSRAFTGVITLLYRSSFLGVVILAKCISK